MPARHTEGAFSFVHDPEEAGTGFTWAGHMHPAVTLRSASDSIKMPCFHVGERVGVLPAFSTFTGGGSVRREKGDRVFGIGGGAVVEV